MFSGGNIISGRSARLKPLLAIEQPDLRTEIAKIEPSQSDRYSNYSAY